ncbi:YhgE/Pip family protein [Levilactobacillus brevis]|uniref:YhgE/Pip domain-containing protein n=1 Tax=Levilactobacillus brevis TaxID=1580 RepID=UPI00325A72F5
MALHEMRYLHQHPAVIRVLLGILVVPLVYAVTFLASVWNPYGELQHLPMAVVNQDRPVTGMAWGRQVTRQLVRDRSLDFRQMPMQRAQQQLATGHVYLVLQIPREASHQLRHLPTATRPLHVTYRTNAGQSAVAAKMGESAMTKLQIRLNQAVVQAEQQAARQQLAQQTRLTAGQLRQIAQLTAANQGTVATLALSRLQTQLARGAQAMTAVTPAQRRAQVTPIRLIQRDTHSLANNGTGMAPYFMTIALFVGCITLNIIYDAGQRHGKYRYFALAWLDKMSFLWGFVVLAASALWLGVWQVNGLRPVHPLATYLFSLLIILAFFSLVTCFRLWLGLTGAWLMLLFMIFQIGCSGGTYPIELTNPLLRAFHPYLPMTIAMSGLHQTISLGGSITEQVAILVGMVVAFSLGTLAYFYRHQDVSAE